MLSAPSHQVRERRACFQSLWQCLGCKDRQDRRLCDRAKQGSCGRCTCPGNQGKLVTVVTGVMDTSVRAVLWFHEVGIICWSIMTTISPSSISHCCTVSWLLIIIFLVPPFLSFLQSFLLSLGVPPGRSTGGGPFVPKPPLWERVRG